MEKEEEEFGEPENKKPHLSSPVASSNSKTVDAAVLQCQNQKLVQQLELQKHELHSLESKIKDCRDKQTAYDDRLITVNQQWNQLVDDLILLGVRAGGGQNPLQALDHAEHYRGSIPSCPAEDIFLCRLLETDSISCRGNGGVIKHVKEALASRGLITRELLKSLEDTISTERTKTDRIAQAFNGIHSAEDASAISSMFDGMLKEEAENLREAIEALEHKNKAYSDEIQNLKSRQSTDQAEIRRLTGELEESMAELEESRRKLVNLKMQKDAAAEFHNSTTGAMNGSLSPEKSSDRSMGLRELRDAIEEAKILAGDRSSELQVAQEDNHVLLKQLQDLQNELKDDKYIYSSRLYTLMNDRLEHWNAEVERYKGLTDSLQADRPLVTRRENELAIKIESADAARNSIDNLESRIEELENELQKCRVEKNDVEVKMEEALQDSGRTDIKAEFRVMASALSKEMEMMEAQQNRWKQTANEARLLREEAKSLKDLLREKEKEQKHLGERCAKQMKEILSLRARIEELQRDRSELEIFLDMYGQEDYDNRNLEEIKESERRAHAQAEVLRGALEEHNLELRVKAAKEAEAACQQRLSAAEAEISDLREKLDVSQREILELTEAIKIKDAEADTYISEIETIGQAYEDMQTQNQHLLQQMTERDDYNIKLVSESVKTKQAQSFLLSEKQMLAKQLQQINSSTELLKSRIARGEDQMKTYLAETIKSIQEEKHLAVSVEMSRWELADAEKELKLLKSAFSSSEKEYEQSQRKIDDIRKEIESERSEKSKLQDELMELNKELAELSSESGEAAVQKLQDEIKACKDILKCGVCFDRPKEVVIVKCYHLFCYRCIQRNLEIRHRKCPGCGTPFGQNDVRFVKI